MSQKKGDFATPRHTPRSPPNGRGDTHAYHLLQHGLNFAVVCPGPCERTADRLLNTRNGKRIQGECEVYRYIYLACRQCEGRFAIPCNNASAEGVSLSSSWKPLCPRCQVAFEQRKIFDKRPSLSLVDDCHCCDGYMLCLRNLMSFVTFVRL